MTLFIVISILLATLFVKKDEWFKSKKYSLRKTQVEKEVWYKKISGSISPKIKDVFLANWRLLVGFLGCHAIIAGFWPDFWLGLARHPLFWTDHVIFILTLVIFREEVERGSGKDKKKVKEFTGLGLLILGILIAGNLFTIFKEKNIFSWNKSDSKRQESVTQIADGPFKPVLLRPNEPLGKDTEKARKFFDAHPSDRGITTEQMLTICQNESGCEHRNSDGTVKRNKNNNGAKDDIGLMQINEGWWEKEVFQEKKSNPNTEIEKWDITMIGDNLKAALWIRDKYGLEPWRTDSRKYKPDVIEITSTEWSEESDFTKRNASIMYEGDVLVMDSNGEVYERGPNAGPGKNFGSSKLKFKAKTDKAKVFILYKD